MTESCIFPTKGYKVYEQHQEYEAGFMDKDTCDERKILKTDHIK
tara:strand:+ start:1953 stop:2084 length:132 start_codon:yes stop_codon:yes gene_type:complete